MKQPQPALGRTAAAILFILPFIQIASGQGIPVIPTPRQTVQRQGFFRITSQTRIVLSASVKADDSGIELLNDRLIELGGRPLKTVREESIRTAPSNMIFLGSPRSSLAREFLERRGGALLPAMKDEGYFLDVNADGLVIIAESARGRFYGVMTLLQLLQRSKKTLTVPQLSIHDWPLQRLRGITDDLSRGQVSTPDNFKKIVRFLATVKLNVYSPYIEDIFTFKNHPLIGKGRGALTPREIKELDAYARKLHVELIPIFETLGHWENILAIPEYVHLAEFPGAHTLNVSDERVYQLLDEMIGELASCFSSPYFNMAADESWDVGLGANKDRVARTDIATVHAEHYMRVFEILKKHGKQPMMYGDIILDNPAVLTKIPKDAIIVDWHYGAATEYSSPSVFSKAGFPFVVSPAVWNFTGPFPNYRNTTANIQEFSREGYQNGAVGILTSNWNDYGGEALRELNYYGYAWTAECAWQPLSADLPSFNEKFFPQFFSLNQAATLAQAAYEILSDPFNQYEWHELWRHPLLPPRATSMNTLWRVHSIESSMPLVRQLLAQLGRAGTKNKEHLEALQFITKLNSWFAQKLTVTENVRAAQKDSLLQQLPDSLRSVVRVMIQPLLSSLDSLQLLFRNLWLETNRPDNLALLLARYDRQKSYWEDIIDNPTATDPTIPSRWVYHPDAHPRSRDTSGSQVPKAYFRHAFDRPDPALTVYVQLLADTRARLFVNGTEAGEVYARHSLSLTVEQQRVKLFDVTSLLKPGKNVFALEAESYGPARSAGINVLEALSGPSGITLVPLDTVFRVSGKLKEGWTRLDFDDSGWLQAVVWNYPFPVIAPNLRKQRLSWIER